MGGCPKARAVLLAAALSGALFGGVAAAGPRLPAGRPAQLPAARPPQASAAGIPVATLALVERRVERESDGKEHWHAVRQGDSLRTGDRIRTGPEALARIEFPWMSLTAGPSTTLYVPASVVLSAVLEEGRAELQSGSHDILKVRTAEAEIRGRGRLVVRRQREITTVMVMAMEGSFRVEAAGAAVNLQAGEGTAVRGRRPPDAPAKLPSPPTVIRPGSDPVYTKRDKDVELVWSPPGEMHHVQLLGFDSEEVLLERDTGPSPQSLRIPWLGTFRWRVSTRDASGLEGLPSRAGYICVVEK